MENMNANDYVGRDFANVIKTVDLRATHRYGGKEQEQQNPLVNQKERES